MNLKKCLVTGGAGFIGSAVAKELIKMGIKVTVIDNLSTGHLKNLPPEATFIRGNCEDESTIKELNSELFDVIFHIAGQSSGEVSYDNPVLDMKANVQSTLVLLKYAIETNCKTFIYASSMSVYGDAFKLPVSEDDPLLPKSFYAVGKLASEHYLKIYQSFGIKTVALRLFNVYGIGQNMENLRQGMASIYLAQALKYNKIIVKGSTERFRDFVYINDVVKAFIHSANKKVPSGVYNVCFGAKVTVKDILDVILEKLNNKISVEVVDSTPGDQFGIYGDGHKFTEIFGFKNETPFKKGMIDMIDWAKINYEA